MNKQIHLSSSHGGAVIKMFLRETNERDSFSPESEYYTLLRDIMGRRTYKVLQPESPDYKYLEQIFLAKSKGLTMGYWKKPHKDRNKIKYTKTHVLKNGDLLCKTKINFKDYPEYIGSGRVVIDYIGCSKCLDQFCRIVESNTSEKPIEIPVNKSNDKIKDTHFREEDIRVGYWAKDPKYTGQIYHIRYKDFPLCDPEFDTSELVFFLHSTVVIGVYKKKICDTCLEIYEGKNKIEYSKANDAVYIDPDKLPPIRLGI
jgi:hypothetical protein